MQKKIAILTCLKASEVCTGYACFKAFNNKKSYFQPYFGQDVELIAFFHCNGCDADYENDEQYKEKMEKIISLKPDAIHVGVCCKPDGRLCPVIENMMQCFKNENINVIEGTH